MEFIILRRWNEYLKISLLLPPSVGTAKASCIATYMEMLLYRNTSNIREKYMREPL